jgi:hypothetical protein
MDQVKKALAWLKAQHFWVLTVLVALIGVGSWFKSAGALNEQYSANETKIKQAFSTSQSMSGADFLPNEAINEKQRQEVQRRAKAVAEMWQQLYNRQRTEVLKWPAEALTQRFVDTVENLKFGSDIPQDMRSIYQNYIANYFPKLPAIIKAPIVLGEAAGRGGRQPYGGGREGRQEEQVELTVPDYICEWLDQDTVRKSLDFPTTPSSLQIWVTQENLWAYVTLLHVIAATNEHVQADRPDNAAVQIVETLDVGIPAAQVSRTNRIELPDAIRTPGGDAGSRAAAAPDLRAGAGRGQAVELTPEEEQQLLLTGRYVDEKGDPLPATGGTDTEYKRLPVRLVLQMDVRQLNFLIAQCANQPLQIEVKEVRINPNESAAGGGRSRTGGAAPVFAGRGESGSDSFPMQPHMARVVIQGVIYIFNEPSSDIIKAASGESGSLAQNQ